MLNSFFCHPLKTHAFTSALWVLVAVVFSGCTQVVEVKHSAEPAQARHISPIATKVLVQPAPKAQQGDFRSGGLFVVGLANQWQLDIESNLPDAVASLLKNTYGQVVVGNHCDDCGLIVRPRIREINIHKMTMQAQVELELDLRDAWGRQIIALQSGGTSAYLNASRVGTGVVGYFVPLLGTALGTTLVRDTVQEALGDALAQMNAQLELHANGGALARHWQPKGAQAQSNGRHDYAAEQVATAAGCQLGADHIALVETHYSQEIYQAHCWGRPAFAITCDLGRCNMAEDGVVASQP